MSIKMAKALCPRFIQLCLHSFKYIFPTQVLHLRERLAGLYSMLLIVTRKFVNPTNLTQHTLVEAGNLP